MNRKIVIGIAGGALAMFLAGGIVLAGPAVERSAAAAAAQPTAAPTAQPGSAGAKKGPGNRQGRGARLALLLGRATAEVTGLQPKDVLAEVRAGKSLAQIAQAHGKTDKDVISSARAKLADRLKQAVANNRMTQARADAALAQFDQAAPQIVASQNLGRLGRRAGAQVKLARAALVRATAEVAGLQPKDVLAELRAGKSLAQIAQAHGKTGDDILAKARELGQQRLDQALDRAKQLIDKPGLGRNQQPSAAPTESTDAQP